MTADPTRTATDGPRGCLIIVCGLPGSGKTTTATQIALECRALRLEPDAWLGALG